MIKIQSIWKGVHWDDERQMWGAEIKIDGTVFNIGFDHSEHLAYDLYCSEKSRIKGWRKHLEEGLHLNPLTGKYHAVVSVGGKLRSLGCSDVPEYAQQLLDEYSSLPGPVRTDQPKKHRGVTFDKKRGLWCVKLRGVVLGYFTDPDLAGEKYRTEKEKSRKYPEKKPKREHVLVMGVMKNWKTQKYEVMRGGVLIGEYDQEKDAVMAFVL